MPESRVDPRLETLLHLWDRLDEDSGQPNTLGVTLVVHGTTYSGLLIPGRVWARSLAGLLRAAPEGPQISSLALFFDDVVDSYESARLPDEARSYLHLANAVIGTPQSGESTGLLLRVRASDVSAWTVGTVGQLPPFRRPVEPVRQTPSDTP